jgi:hypothetical protein
LLVDGSRGVSGGHPVDELTNHLVYGPAERRCPFRTQLEPPLRLNDDEAITIRQGANVIDGEPGFSSQCDQPGIADQPRCRLVGDDQRGDPRRDPSLIADPTTRSGTTGRRARTRQGWPPRAAVG